MSATRQQIAEVFRRRVGEVGYAKATLDDVARTMRISKKTIYVHFDGKRDIYAWIVERQAAEEKRRLVAMLAALPTCRAKVEAALRILIDMGRRHVEETERDEWLAEYEVAADAFRKANGDLLRELVQAGMDAGEFAQGDTELVERMVTAMVIEYLLTVRADVGYDRDQELLERILRFIG
ncbi:MAG TPA: TetR/AcrR family transcriptional regulator [Thermoleophilia bacterium]|nr:TetR/AcrR family transcriptional regulator [Thermoleophilia bacterium]